MEAGNEVLLNVNSDGLQCTDKMNKCKDAVCLIYAMENENLRRGTGFFARLQVNGIEIKCIVTNNHVLPSKVSASGGEARFFYEGSSRGVPIELEPERLFHTNEVLDYSLIGCDTNTLENELGVTPLEFTDLGGSINDDIFIFQHPKGEPKQFSYQKICNIMPQYIFYKADTDIGSSGSPVLRKFQLIAIHSKGSEQQQYNKGTLCSAILHDLNSGKYSKSPDISRNTQSGRKREAPQIIPEASPAKIPNRTKQFIKDPEQVPTEKELNDLSEDIANNWKRLGRELGLGHNLIMSIHRDNINHDDIIDKAFAMLMKWKEKKDMCATFGVLGSALQAIDMVATARKHC